MNDLIRDRLMNRRQQVPLWGEIFAGASAGALNCVVVNPFEAIKIRIQAAGQMFPRVPISSFEVMKQLGFRGMYRVSKKCFINFQKQKQNSP